MQTIAIRTFFLPLALLLGSAALSACSSDPQEQYEDAIEELEEAREERKEARQELEEKLEELKEMQANLDESENKLQAARKNVDQASQTVGKTVTDEVLFRTIQRELLAEDQFEDAAISVGVTNRVVTLTGNVPNEETRKQALEIARSQAGVKNAVDRLKVGEAQSAPSENQSAGDKQQSGDGGDKKDASGKQKSGGGGDKETTNKKEG